jgi:hypothetical protein
MRIRRHAFTLVEVLIAGLLMTVIFIGLWNLFTGGSKMMDYGTWYSATTSEVKVGLRKLREDIGKANYPTVISPTGIDDNGGVTKPGYEVEFKPLTNLAGAAPGAKVKILHFFLCRPEKKDFTPSSENQTPEEIECFLESEGRTLRYRKVAKVGSPGAEELYNKVFMRDVDEVKIDRRDLKAAGKTGADLVGMVDITITCAHQVYKDKMKVKETTTARVAVAQKQL